MADNVIEVKELTHKFGELCAVNGVSFAVRKGEIFSFLGPNGAGKSTVINILTTLLPVQSGYVQVAGHNVSAQPHSVRSKIGIVFQEETLDRDLTVWETLEFHGSLYSVPKKERKSRIDEMLHLVELDEKKDVRTKNLSGGMKRRLEIARGLMTRPEVLFLDEPTIGLDTQTRRRLWEYIKEVNRDGTTIFLTTHYMDEADLASNWISIVDHGQIIVSGTPSQLKVALGRDMIYISTSDDSSAMKILESMDAVREVKTSTRGLVVSINTDGSRCLPVIMRRLKEGGVETVSVNLKKPTLDDVFVHYTGREIRNSGPEKFRRMVARGGR